jgi:cytochrome c
MQKERTRVLALVHGLAGALSAALLLTIAGPARAVDADAAQALARRSNCFKCHSVDKKKEAPPWKELAAKLKGKPDAQATLIKHITTGPKVKLEDGSEEEHPIIKTKNPDEIKNIVDWILSL